MLLSRWPEQHRIRRDRDLCTTSLLGRGRARKSRAWCTTSLLGRFFASNSRVCRTTSLLGRDSVRNIPAWERSTSLSEKYRRLLHNVLAWEKYSDCSKNAVRRFRRSAAWPFSCALPSRDVARPHFSQAETLCKDTGATAPKTASFSQGGTMFPTPSAGRQNRRSHGTRRAPQRKKGPERVRPGPCSPISARAARAPADAPYSRPSQQ